MLKIILGTASILTLSACGLKGDLYLPEASHTTQQSSNLIALSISDNSLKN